jgi:hypothetical protein
MWKSEVVLSFTDKEIWPTKPTLAALLDLLADGRLVMNTVQRNGRPEFIFWAGVNETTILKNWQCRTRDSH